MMDSNKRDSMRSIKLADPAHIIGRLAKGEVAGIVCPIDQAKALGRDFILTDGMSAFGVVQLRSGVKFPTGYDAQQTLSEKLDSVNASLIAKHESAAWFHPLELTEVYDPPRSIKTAKQEPAKLENDRARLRKAEEDNPGERCGSCQYFTAPNQCSAVTGPVEKDLVCDWIQSRDVEGAPLYKVSDEDWLAFGAGMIEEQPYQHIVRDVALTPAGPLVMIEDTARVPHKFSLSRAFHVAHTSLEHHWTQPEVDRLIEVGQGVERQKSDNVESLSANDLRELLQLMDKEFDRREKGAKVDDLLRAAAFAMAELNRRGDTIPDHSIVREAGKILKAEIQVETSTANGHTHIATVDSETGNGKTSVDSGHGHEVVEWVATPNDPGAHQHTVPQERTGSEKGEIVPGQTEPHKWYSWDLAEARTWLRDNVEDAKTEPERLPNFFAFRQLPPGDATFRTRWIGPAAKPADSADAGRPVLLTLFASGDRRGAVQSYKFYHGDEDREKQSKSRGNLPLDRASDTPLPFTVASDVSTPSNVTKTDRQLLADLPFRKRLPVVKADDLRYVLGIVLEPNDGKNGNPLDPDAQQDVYSAEDVRDAAWAFLAKYRGLGVMHQREAGEQEMEVVESFVAPVDFTMDGQEIRKGTWLLGAIVHSNELWKKVKSGDFGAWSIDGEARRGPLESAEA